MKTHLCCGSENGGSDHARHPAAWLRRARRLAGWLVPATTLVLLPKCPACVAAYVGLATGISFSLPVAGYARVVVVAACVGWLSFIVATRVQGLMTRRARR